VSLLRIISRSIWQSLWKHLPASSRYTLYERAYARADICIRIRISAVRCAHAQERTRALCRANVAERASTESRKASKGKVKGQTTPYAALAVERIRLRLRFSVSPLASGITNISTASSPPRPSLVEPARSRFAIRVISRRCLWTIEEIARCASRVFTRERIKCRWYVSFFVAQLQKWYETYRYYMYILAAIFFLLYLCIEIILKFFFLCWMQTLLKSEQKLTIKVLK